MYVVSARSRADPKPSYANRRANSGARDVKAEGTRRYGLAEIERQRVFPFVLLPAFAFRFRPRPNRGLVHRSRGWRGSAGFNFYLLENKKGSAAGEAAVGGEYITTPATPARVRRGA